MRVSLGRLWVSVDRHISFVSDGSLRSLGVI